MPKRPAWSNQDSAAWRRWWAETPKDELISDCVRPSRGEIVSDTGAIFLGLTEALMGTGSVSPNPLVGCAILSKENKFLSSGGHLKFGGPHAEAAALAHLDPETTSRAKVFVTLEPCAHQGKTPSCAHALSKLSVGSVHYLAQDPNPLVQGRGVSILQAAGIGVVEEVAYADLGRSVAEIFFFNHKEQDIFVGLKAATTRSGVYAHNDSSRFWITGARAREYGHYLRLLYDGIVVGTSTALMDNPHLNIRSQFVSGRSPVRIVLDPNGKLIERRSSLHAFSLEPEKAYLVVGERLKSPQDNQIIRLPTSSQGSFSWQDLKSALWDRGLRSLLIEGGGDTWKDAIEKKAVQKLHWFVGINDASEVESESKKIWNIPSQLKSRPPDFMLGDDEYYEQLMRP